MSVRQNSSDAAPARAASLTAGTDHLDQLLDRPLTTAMIDEATARVARKRSQEISATVRILVFGLRAEMFAVRTSHVVRMAPAIDVYRIPHRSNRLIRGMGGLAGELVLCADLGALLQPKASQGTWAAGQTRPTRRTLLLDARSEAERTRSTAEPPRRARTLSSEPSDRGQTGWGTPQSDAPGNRWAVEVDHVVGVVAADINTLRAPPVTIAQDDTAYVESLVPMPDGRVAGLLALARVLAAFRAELP